MTVLEVEELRNPSSERASDETFWREAQIALGLNVTDWPDKSDKTDEFWNLTEAEFSEWNAKLTAGRFGYVDAENPLANFVKFPPAELLSPLPRGDLRPLYRLRSWTVRTGYALTFSEVLCVWFTGSSLLARSDVEYPARLSACGK